MPIFFSTFCALNAGVEAIVAGAERLTFADLDRWSNQLAPALVRSGIRKGDRVGIAMRNCPAWVVTYMAALKAGAIATLLNGWWQSHELDHALRLTEPTLILADAPRAKRIAATGGDWKVMSLDVDLPLAEALAPLLEGRRRSGRASRDHARRRCDDPVHLGLDRRGQGRAVDPSRGHDRGLCLLRSA